MEARLSLGVECPRCHLPMVRLNDMVYCGAPLCTNQGQRYRAPTIILEPIVQPPIVATHRVYTAEQIQDRLEPLMTFAYASTGVSPDSLLDSIRSRLRKIIDGL